MLLCFGSAWALIACSQAATVAWEAKAEVLLYTCCTMLGVLDSHDLMLMSQQMNKRGWLGVSF